MGKFIAHIPCPSCGSKDNLTVFADGYYCFTEGCEPELPDNYIEEMAGIKHKEEKKVVEFVLGEYKDIKARGINSETCEHYSYKIGKNKDQQHCHIEQYFDENRKLVGQKLRFQDKSFTTIGKVDRFFGQHLYPNGGKTLVITEGAIDCLSVAQVFECKYPVVSIPFGAHNALVYFKQHFEWLNKFEKIVLMFDNDKVGQEHVEKVARLFDYNKCLIAKTELKDANEMLLQGKVKELIQCYYNAKPFRPASIIKISDVLPDVNKLPPTGKRYYWDTLTKWTYGMKENQITLFLSDSGIGKTTAFKHNIVALIEQGVKVGIALLEDNPAEALVDIAGIMKKKNYREMRANLQAEKQDAIKRKESVTSIVKQLEDLNEEIVTAIKEIQVKSDMCIMTQAAADDYKTMLSNIRYLASAEDCKYIFIDHLTVFTDQNGGLEVSDKMMSELYKMKQEYSLHIACIAHIRKNDSKSKSVSATGAMPTMNDVKGSGSLYQYTSTVFGFSPHPDDPNDNTRRRMKLLKCRDSGKYRNAVLDLRYNFETGVMQEEGWAMSDEVVDELRTVEVF